MNKMIEIINTSDKELEFQMYGINLFRTIVPGESIKVQINSDLEDLYYNKLVKNLNIKINTTSEPDIPTVENLKFIIPSGDLLGKTITDICTNLDIKENKASGTLKYVKDYTGFNSDPSEQEGYFFPFKLDTSGKSIDKTIATFEVVGGSGKKVNFDKSDFISIVFLGKTEDEAKSKSVKVVVDWNGDGTKIEEIINLSELVYESNTVTVSENDLVKEYTKDELLTMKKEEIIKVAESRGIEVSGTKEAMADQIVASYEN